MVDGIALSTDLSNGQEIVTLQGQSVTVTINGDDVFIDDAQVVIANVVTINGVIHVIDAVLTPASEELPTIFDIVESSEVHNTLEAALLAAELDGVLAGEGSFTLFAPTDEAFANLPANLVNALLTDPSGVLTDILLYHVVGSAAFGPDLSDGQEIATLFDDQNVVVTIESGNVFINGAQVIVADIEASNGVVHVIDAVLIPETTTILDVVVGDTDFSTLATALTEANLASIFGEPGAYTVFAPTNAAFDALPDGLLEALLAEPEGDLTQILLYHVVDGIALSTDLSDGQEIATLFGEEVTVTIEGDDVLINNALVVVTDIVTVNGVIHVIDAVLVPTTLSTNDETALNSVMVYPNPSSDFAVINVDSNKPGRTILNVMNVSGQLVRSADFGWNSTGVNQHILDVRSIPSGYYILQIDVDGSRSSQKLVITK